ncbi:MAG: hypothetical protein GQ583_12685 [Methyloprofundus sp.]|nr:hypothetical protein [Methyloprofundus sp.]
MKKSIYIFSLSLLFSMGLYLVPVDDVDAGERHRDRRARRAYVAGAVRGSHHKGRRERRHDYRNERRERHERRETRRSIATGVIAVGVGAAVIRNSRERRERY